MIVPTLRSLDQPISISTRHRFARTHESLVKKFLVFIYYVIGIALLAFFTWLSRSAEPSGVAFLLMLFATLLMPVRVIAQIIRSIRRRTMGIVLERVASENNMTYLHDEPFPELDPVLVENGTPTLLDKSPSLLAVANDSVLQGSSSSPKRRAVQGSGVEFGNYTFRYVGGKQSRIIDHGYCTVQLEHSMERIWASLKKGSRNKVMDQLRGQSLFGRELGSHMPDGLLKDLGATDGQVDEVNQLDNKSLMGSLDPALMAVLVDFGVKTDCELHVSDNTLNLWLKKPLEPNDLLLVQRLLVACS